MKTYELRATSNPHVFRVVDRAGEWAHYFEDTTNTYLRGATSILGRSYPKGEGFYIALKRATPEEWDRKLSEAGDRGDAIHQFIAKILSGEQCDRHTKVLAENNIDYRELADDEWDAILSFERWWNAHAPKLIAYEQTVASLSLGYAGTLDVICRLTKSCGARCCNCKDAVGKVALLDWKSGGGIYESYGAQVACYAYSDLSHLLHGLTVTVTGIVRIGTSHVTTGGYECKFYSQEETARNMDRFLAAKLLDDQNYRPFDPAKEIRDIPETLSLTIEREEISTVAEKPNKTRKPRVKKSTKATKKKAV